MDNIEIDIHLVPDELIPDLARPREVTSNRADQGPFRLTPSIDDWLSNHTTDSGLSGDILIEEYIYSTEANAVPLPTVGLSVPTHLETEPAIVAWHPINRPR